MIQRAAAAAQVESAGDGAGDKFFCSDYAVLCRPALRQSAGDSGGKSAAGAVSIFVIDMRSAKPVNGAAAEKKIVCRLGEMSSFDQYIAV